MNMLVYKDGKIIMSEAGKPFEGEKPLENLYACISDPADGDTLVYNATAGMWMPGNPLPIAITEPEDGDTLAYNAESGKWVNVHAEAAGGEG